MQHQRPRISCSDFIHAPSRRRAARLNARYSDERHAEQGARVRIVLMLDIEAIGLPTENQRDQLPLDHQGIVGNLRALRLPLRLRQCVSIVSIGVEGAFKPRDDLIAE